MGQNIPLKIEIYSLVIDSIDNCSPATPVCSTVTNNISSNTVDIEGVNASVIRLNARRNLMIASKKTLNQKEACSETHTKYGHYY